MSQRQILWPRFSRTKQRSLQGGLCGHSLCLGWSLVGSDYTPTMWWSPNSEFISSIMPNPTAQVTWNLEAQTLNPTSRLDFVHSHQSCGFRRFLSIQPGALEGHRKDFPLLHSEGLNRVKLQLGEKASNLKSLALPGSQTWKLHPEPKTLNRRTLQFEASPWNTTWESKVSKGNGLLHGPVPAALCGPEYSTAPFGQHWQFCAREPSASTNGWPGS